MIYFFSEAARAEHLEQVSYYEERRALVDARPRKETKRRRKAKA